MPVYDFHCPDCRRTEAVVRKVDQRDGLQMCSACSSSMVRRMVYRTAVRGDYEGYVSPASGKWIEGRAAHEEDLKRSGCRVFESGERENFIKNKAKHEEQLAQNFETIVEKAALTLGEG